jgi:hypothetical protein
MQTLEQKVACRNKNGYYTNNKKLPFEGQLFVLIEILKNDICFDSVQY